MPSTNKAIAHNREVAIQMAAFERERRGKRERWLSVREAISERRHLQFRPYRLRRDGKTVSTRYTFNHATMIVRDSEYVEAFFHAQRMRATGYTWCAPGTSMSVGPGGAWRKLAKITSARGGM